MLVRTVLALLIFAALSNVFAGSCNERLIRETTLCRATFKRCMANPIFSNLCNGQLENCTKVANQKARICSNKEQQCMNDLIGLQDICQSSYFECIKSPGRNAICAYEMDDCSKDAETITNQCIDDALNAR